jgi:phosphomannomutase
MAGIFKAYDIRGVVNESGTVGEGLSVERAYLIGRGLAATVFENQISVEGASRCPIVVSRDMRTHSPQMAAELIRGLSEGGCDVLDMGLAATPMNYWANVHYKSGGSVTVTASHNGPEYNGFKVSGAGATPLDFSTGLNRVEEFVLRSEADSSTPSPASNVGTVTVVEDALGKYLDFMDGFVEPGSTNSQSSRKLKIGIDAGNGMGGFFLPEFFARHPEFEVVPLYWELDGSFPNHEADPLKEENLRDVQALVKEHTCDFGVAYDGDADRCMFVDNTGANISSDLVTAFIAEEMLSSTPSSPILYDLRSSRIVPEWIEQHGGVPVRGRVGHSFMKRLLKEKGARFGGELSGHYYFADCFNTDSGLMAMIQIINIWRKRQNDSGSAASADVVPLSQMIEPLRKYAATGEINFRVPDVAVVQRKIEEHYGAQGANLDHLDGLTVEFDDWWFNLRSSNTEPLLRLNLEAANPAARTARLSEVQDLIGQPPLTGSSH